MEEFQTVSLGIVVPTLNAAGTLNACMARIGGDHAGLDIDVVLADGGSSDATLDMAARFDVRVTVAEGGRGPQLARGAETVFGDWLLFVHSDTLLPRHWPEIVRAFATAPMNAERAGYFGLVLDDDHPGARRLEQIVEWRCRRFGLPYGDQALLLPRSLYQEVGGHPEIPLMEDVALARRIGAARLTRLPATVLTSASRYRRSGYLVRSARNLVCLCLYFLGLPPGRIKRLYG